MSSYAWRRSMIIAILVILSLVTTCGQSAIEADPYELLSKKLGKPIDESEYLSFMKTMFTPGMDYKDVHQQVNEIGEYWIVDEIVYSFGGKMEIIEIQTGSVPLEDYEYLKWSFVFDTEDKLIKVSINSWR